MWYDDFKELTFSREAESLSCAALMQPQIDRSMHKFSSHTYNKFPTSSPSPHTLCAATINVFGLLRHTCLPSFLITFSHQNVSIFPLSSLDFPTCSWSVAMCARKRRDHVCRWPVARGINKNKWFRTVSCGSSKARTKKNVCYFFCLASKAKYRGAFNNEWNGSDEPTRVVKTAQKTWTAAPQLGAEKKWERERERKTKQSKTLRQMKAYIGQRVIKRCINVSLIRWKIYDKSFSVVFFYAICSLGCIYDFRG